MDVRRSFAHFIVVCLLVGTTLPARADDHPAPPGMIDLTRAVVVVDPDAAKGWAPSARNLLMGLAYIKADGASWGGTPEWPQDARPVIAIALPSELPQRARPLT